MDFYSTENNKDMFVFADKLPHNMSINDNQNHNQRQLISVMTAHEKHDSYTLNPNNVSSNGFK